MAFNVSYIFSARDQFSAVARKIKEQTKKVRKEFKGLPKDVSASNSKFKKIGTVGLRSMKKLGRGVVNTTRKLRKLRKEAKKSASSVGSGFKRMAAAALGFFGAREFLNLGARFQSSMADLSAITGAVGKDFDLLQTKSLALAKASITSQAEVAGAIKLVASAKPELLKNLPLLIKTTEQVLLLKNASGIELADAAEITASSLNIFGKGAKFAGKFVNILAAGSKFGSSEIANTGAAVLIAGPAARAAGLSFLQLNAAIQATARGAIFGSQAGTALQSILGRLRRAGLDFEKIGLEGAFTAVGNALDAVTDSTARAKLEAEIFGEEHAKVGLALVSNAKLLGQFERELKGTNLAQEQAAIRLDTFDAKARRLGISIKDALIKTFLRLEPTLSKLTEQGVRLFDAITPGQIEAIADKLKGFVNVSVKIAKQFSTQLIPIVKEFMATMDTKSIAMIVSNLTSIADAVNIILAPVKILASLFKGVGVMIGESAAQLKTFNFQESNLTSFKDAFTIGSKLFGIFEREKPAIELPKPALISNNVIQLPKTVPILPDTRQINPVQIEGGSSRADINVNLRAPEGVIESIKTKRTGNGKAMNLGVNMAEAS